MTAARSIVFTATLVASIAAPLAGLVGSPSLVAAQQIAPQAATKVMTMRESLTLSSWGSYALSPDGRTVAFTKSERDTVEFESKSHIWLYDITTGTQRQLTNSENGESGPRWLEDGRLLFSSNRDEETRLWVISPSGGEAVQFIEDDDAPSGSFSPDYARIAFTKRTDRPDQKDWDERVKRRDDAYYAEKKLTYSHIWVYDVATGDSTQLTTGEFDHSGPEWSPDGRWIAYASNRTGTQMGDPDRSNNTDLFIIAATGGSERRLTTNRGPDGSPEFSPDGRFIAYSSSDRENHNADQSDLKVVPVAGGEPVNLTADFDYDVGGFDWSPDARHIYFSATQGLGSQLYKVPAEGGEPVAIFTEDDVTYGVADRTKDWSKWLITSGSLADPGSLYIADADGANMKLLFRENDGLPEFRVARAEAITWKGADGWDIEGVLTYPLDYQPGQRYPLILQVHGGPHGRFSTSFSTGTQIWAARGYAVLQGNPRGSSGRTFEFSNANVGDWGGKDFVDIMNGVDHVIELGVADPDRMAVMGGSYGGFMTFWAVTQTDRFKAAIGHAGISDWFSFYGQTDIPYLLEFGFTGLPWQSKDTYEQWSPIEHSEDVVTPLLITHGEEDERVPISQAEQYYRTLKKLGKTVEFLRFPREGHGIREPRHRIHLDQEQAKWLERFLRAGRVSTEGGG